MLDSTLLQVKFELIQTPELTFTFSDELLPEACSRALTHFHNQNIQIRR